MKQLLNIVLFAFILVSFTGFRLSNAENPARKKYIDPANMDKGIHPGNNFYLYSNGGWLKNNPVPPSKTRWGSFDELREESIRRLLSLLQDASSRPGSDARKLLIGQFYNSGMDSNRIDQLGFIPIKEDLQKIEAALTIEDLLSEMAVQRTNSGPSFFMSIYIGQDRKNVNRYIPQISQAGISLPDRDYYLKKDSRSIHLRNEFLSHLVKMFVLTGKPAQEAKHMSEAVLRIESAMAQAQWSRVELRDPYRTYNKLAWKDLSAAYSNIHWQRLAVKMMVSGTDSLIVTNPNYLKTIDILLTALPLNEWKAYAQWQVIRNAAPYLSRDFVNQHFGFMKVLTGQKEQTPRWQRISSLIDNQLGDAIGQLYVEKYFSPDAKTRMLDLVNNLQAVFSERLDRISWMSDETKEKAHQKLQAITKKIGYPDKWKDYSNVEINPQDFYGNVRRTNRWAYLEMIKRLGKPVDKTQWGMTPPTINAYYSPLNNEIAFPAGILQFPFFDFGADDAVNYGGIGAVIGHEMTHGFDDQGSKYGADGNLENWWDKSDTEKFTQLSDRVVRQYNILTVLDTMHVNGKLTLGENMADLGGLAVAFEAFKKTSQYREKKKIDGFTPAQRFFLGWAQIWRNNTLPETSVQLILTDSHAPGEYRANVPVSNMDEWYEAFGVKEGHKLFREKEDRITIW